MLSADMMIDPSQERPALSLRDMSMLPYVLIYDSETDTPADIAKLNAGFQDMQDKNQLNF